ncbi:MULTISPECIES: PTS sugar transporter subunit IIA [unclassified Streptococcus]|uniref:PTS sugar transporter subunit IIA n=1 Tax=unclassified Streptococcus TaxID=2608887 RepID=UPI001072DFD8|nr:MULTISPECIES: PTS sugar transporter subunit IIA [unclassified Streptococcus]MBF0787311.1 PTS sugar transporter subunit IIA [Streptococcus sp. 19428wC2_LYSM12]MCQ9212650.1 PTS sugar transporter subunit IIA [Streptococcus sp. B01]MCQ9213989.1 PTS sugar transporter subunit IIA [Streptococcus sp. O1]TFV05798.1 PTS sugar transporter subunit IIA [Streptococcus sp. LYSM12]
MLFNRGILIASHGDFAKGALMTSEMFVGETTTDRVRVLSLMPGENISDFEQLFKKQVGELLKVNREVIILTDLIGGSPNNVALSQFIDQERVHIVTGFNIPLLVELISSYNVEIDVEGIISNAQRALFKVKSKLNVEEEEELCL